MNSISIFAALMLAQSTPADTSETGAGAAQTSATLSSENRAVVRCSAAFALVSYGQTNGNAEARKWPELSERGREFFVRALAGLMDDTGLNRDGVSQLVSSEAQALVNAGNLNEVMPACLLMLETSGV